MRTIAVLAFALACSCKKSEPPELPVPASKPAPPTDVIFRDSTGRVLTRADLRNVTGSVDWSIVGGDNVPPAAEALQNEGRAAGSNGDYTKAIDAFTRAHDAAPNWPYPLYELAFTY